MLWNFFPFDLVLWWPLKAGLNLLLFPFWIISIPFYEFWNLLPNTAGMLLWVVCSVLFWPILFFFFFLLGIFLAFTYFFTTSLPDLFVVTSTTVFTIILIAGLTGGTFNFDKLGEKAWLEGG
tara:strand:- start:120 stop:485 length:366 start_codon:yes stop_codon:yes gene_type:complete